jgi:hypothetical protein
MARTIDERDPYYGKCEYCSINLDADECGEAEHEAIWIDADGKTDGETVSICDDCLKAGCPTGPGYILA